MKRIRNKQVKQPEKEKNGQPHSLFFCLKESLFLELLQRFTGDKQQQNFHISETHTGQELHILLKMFSLVFNSWSNSLVSSKLDQTWKPWHILLHVLNSSYLGQNLDFDPISQTAIMSWVCAGRCCFYTWDALNKCFILSLVGVTLFGSRYLQVLLQICVFFSFFDWIFTG